MATNGFFSYTKDGKTSRVLQMCYHDGGDQLMEFASDLKEIKDDASLIRVAMKIASSYWFDDSPLIPNMDTEASEFTDEAIRAMPGFKEFENKFKSSIPNFEATFKAAMGIPYSEFLWDRYGPNKFYGSELYGEDESTKLGELEDDFDKIFDYAIYTEKYGLSVGEATIFDSPVGDYAPCVNASGRTLTILGQDIPAGASFGILDDWYADNKDRLEELLSGEIFSKSKGNNKVRYFESSINIKKVFPFKERKKLISSVTDKILAGASPNKAISEGVATQNQNKNRRNKLK